MRHKIIIFFLFLSILSCHQQKKKPNFDTEHFDTNSIFGHYRCKPILADAGSGITLYPDSLYTYSAGNPAELFVDTGSFTLKNSILILKSFLRMKVDTVNNVPIENEPQTGRELLLKNKKIYYNDVAPKKYDPNIFWLKYMERWTPHDLLDSTGEGNLALFELDGTPKEEGEYKNYILFNGYKYAYSDSGAVMHAEIIKAGHKIKDSVFDGREYQPWLWHKIKH